jgi:uncharacterized membrane protein
MKIQINNLGWFSIVGMIIVYILSINLFFEYVINREVHQAIQATGLLLAMAYTVFIIRIIILNLTRVINIKKKKND